MSNDKTTNEIVTKSNELIQSCYSFSLLEQQLLLFIVSTVDPFTENMDFDYKIYVKDFLKKFPKKNKNIYGDIENAVMNKFWERDLMYWNYDKYSYGKFRWLSHVYYEKKEGYFLLEFAKAVKPFLHQLKSNFTSYYIDNINKFKSTFSIRIYEICMCNINKLNKEKFVFISQLNTLREWLELEEKYLDFHDFKRRVLQKACTEINAHSDLLIDFEEIKEGRKVVSIKFIVQRKDGTKRASYAREEENQVGTEVEFCHDKKESSREGENFAMTKNEKTTEVPAYPPQVQNGNCTYKDSDTQTISKLSSSDNKVNTVIRKSGCDAKSHILETKGDITTEPKFCHDKKNAIEKTDSNDKNFAMAKNANGILPQSDDYEKHEILLAQMCKYNLKRKRALDLIKDYGAYACRLGIANFEKAIEFGGQIDNAAGYLTRCIENATELVKGSDEIKAERLKEYVDATFIELSCLNLEKQLRKNPLVKKKEVLSNE